MDTMISNAGRQPVGYLTNSEGKRTHVIFKIDDAADDWDSLPSVAADEHDRAFLARFRQEPEAFLTPLPTLNPIRKARLAAGITQEVLAHGLGISPAALSKQEQEGHAPRPATIARALAKLAALTGKA